MQLFNSKVYISSEPMNLLAKENRNVCVKISQMECLKIGQMFKILFIQK